MVGFCCGYDLNLTRDKEQGSNNKSKKTRVHHHNTLQYILKQVEQKVVFCFIFCITVNLNKP